MTVVLLQLDPQTQAWWWGTLAAGALVLVVLVVLLRALAKVVEDIDAELEEIWTTGKRLAGNTATTWMISATTMTVAALDEEIDAVKEQGA